MKSYILIIVLILLSFIATSHAATSTPPEDFNTNFIDYPKADNLPKYTSPGALATAGRITVSGQYFLTKDIYARAEGFIIEASDVTLDLRGHSIIYACEDYPNAYGISLPPKYNHPKWFPRGQYAIGNNDNFTITDTAGGGSIIKGTGFPAEKSSAIFVYEGNGLTIKNIEILTSGVAASAIETHYLAGDVIIKGVKTDYEYLRGGNPVIDPSILRYPTGGDDIHWYWVLNRHSEFVGSIILGESKMNSCNISDNLFMNSPQMGVFISDSKFSPPTYKRDDTFFNNPESHIFKIRIENNSIKLNAKVTNCYGLKLDTSDGLIFNNKVEGYGAGIHVGGKYLYIHHNTINVSQGANPEYPTRLWAHGIKLEGTTVTLTKLVPDQCLIIENNVRVSTRGPLEHINKEFWYVVGTPDQYFGHNGSARALDLSPTLGTWNEIKGNIFRADRIASDHPSADALRLTEVKRIYPEGTSSAEVYDNTFETNDYFISIDWPPQDSDFSSIKIYNNKYSDTSETSTAKLVYLSGQYPLPEITIQNPISSPSSVFKDNKNYYVWNNTPFAKINILTDGNIHRDIIVNNGEVSDSTYEVSECDILPAACLTKDDCDFYWPQHWCYNACQNMKCHPVPTINLIRKTTQ